MKGPCCNYDLTIKAEMVEVDSLKDKFRDIAKSWCFQKECGLKTGYLHYQCRISLKVKKRDCELAKLFDKEWGMWCSPTSIACKDDNFYVMKEDTRVEGPWSDTDENVYIPRQVREIIKLYPWQEQIASMVNVWDTRHINVVLDNSGNIGKSVLMMYLRCHGLARRIPPINDAKDLMRIVCDMPTARCYLIDMPRAMNKERLYGLFSAVESIKDGFAYDDRYHYKEKLFDCPNIWMFTNVEPDMGMLSRDRWRFYEVKDNELCSV